MIKPATAGLISLLVFVVGTAPAAARNDDPDVDTSADYVYTVNLDTAAIDVRIELTVTADKANLTVSDGYYQYYLTNYFISIPSEAENLVVVDQSESELEVVRTPDDVTDVLEITLRRNVYYRQSATLTLTFTLPQGERGTDDITRINQAYASFFAWTSPEIEAATVTVVTPETFVDDSEAPVSFVPTPAEDVVNHVADDIDPETYFALVSMSDGGSLEQEIVALDDGAPEVVVSYWPGDEAWRDHATEAIEQGIPSLTELIDLPWPLSDSLEVRESNSPYLTGYAGWYDSDAKTIEIGDELEDHVLYHELSHVWFNDALFTDRWITEGLAELFAAHAVAAGGQDAPKPLPVEPTDRFAIPLANFEVASDSDVESWGYDASWHVMDSIAEEVSLETLVDTIHAANERRISYVGDRTPEVLTEAADWRRLLDLLENADGVNEAAVAELFETWVVDSGADSRSLEARSAARDRYTNLIDTGGAWAAPVGVRQAMADWAFSAAEDAMSESEAALASRDELLEVVSPTGAELPLGLETAYEEADDSLAVLETRLDEALEAGTEVREAHDLAVSDHSLIETVGLLGADLDAQALDAVAAFERGQLTEAVIQANEVDSLLDGAASKGMLRLAITLGIAGALLVIGSFLYRRRA